MNQAQIADLAKRSALRTVQTDIGNCASCVATPSTLSGLGCPCESAGKKSGSKCGCSQMSAWTKEFGAWTKEFGGVASSIWDAAKPALPWILLSIVISGFAGWKLGNIYCGTKNKINSVLGNKKGRNRRKSR